MALRDIVPRRQPRGYIKWGYSQDLVLYLTYTTGTFKNSPCVHLIKYLCNYNIGFEIVMSHFRNTLFIDDSFIPVDRLYIYFQHSCN